ncbi:MAG: hypothetical protein ACI97A_001643 [Planctomycetota bacterium]|jgi:hypothetical protein
MTPHEGAHFVGKKKGRSQMAAPFFDLSSLTDCDYLRFLGFGR